MSGSPDPRSPLVSSQQKLSALLSPPLWQRNHPERRCTPRRTRKHPSRTATPSACRSRKSRFRLSTFRNHCRLRAALTPQSRTSTAGAWKGTKGESAVKLIFFVWFDLLNLTAKVNVEGGGSFGNDFSKCKNAIVGGTYMLRFVQRGWIEGVARSERCSK